MDELRDDPLMIVLRTVHQYCIHKQPFETQNGAHVFRVCIEQRPIATPCEITCTGTTQEDKIDSEVTSFKLSHE